MTSLKTLAGIGLLVAGIMLPTVGRAQQPLVASTAYYVSPTGNDAQDGTREHPWASPGYASRQLQPGDTLVILGGRYVLSVYDDDILIPRSGQAGAWITIRGERGNRPVLAGRDDLAMAVELSNTRYLHLENLEITSDNGAPFRDAVAGIDGPIEHLVLKDLYIHHVDEFGVDLADVNDLLLVDSEISHCGLGAVGGPEGTHGGWRNVRIDGSTLSYSGHYFQGGPGPSPYDRPDGFGIEPSEGPIEISRTRAEHNRGDGLDSKAAHTYIHECIVANNAADGIKLWGTGSTVENTLIYGRGDGNPEPTPWAAVVLQTEDANASFTIVNTTIDDAAGNNYVMYVQYDYPTTPITLTVRNTIVSSRGPDAHLFLGDAVQATLTHNLFYVPGDDLVLEHGGQEYTAAQVGTLGTENRYGDPLFVTPAFGTDGDYHLQAGSPAVDAGATAGAPSTDLDGHPRPYAGGVDIGAYERGSTGIGNERPTPVPGLSSYSYPNPFSLETTIQYTLQHPAAVRLAVYDILGREVTCLVDQWQPGGSYSVRFSADDRPSGLYFYRLQAGRATRVQALHRVR